MDSLDAQCLVTDLAHLEEAQAPDQWQHLADGTLAYRFGNSPNTFSWPPPVVTSMAERWRSSGRPVPAAIEEIIDVHRAFMGILDNGGRDHPDRIIHDLRTGDVTAYWDDEKVVVLLEPGPDRVYHA